MQKWKDEHHWFPFPFRYCEALTTTGPALHCWGFHLQHRWPAAVTPNAFWVQCPSLPSSQNLRSWTEQDLKFEGTINYRLDLKKKKNANIWHNIFVSQGANSIIAVIIIFYQYNFKNWVERIRFRSHRISGFIHLCSCTWKLRLGLILASPYSIFEGHMRG